MKWAPNKKMHFEVAAIRAIQTLSQATLTEVLDTLTAIRGGAPLPEKAGLAEPGARSQKSGSAPAARRSGSRQRPSAPKRSLSEAVAAPGRIEASRAPRPHRPAPKVREEPAARAESPPTLRRHHRAGCTRRFRRGNVAAARRARAQGSPAHSGWIEAGQLVEINGDTASSPFRRTRASLANPANARTTGNFSKRFSSELAGQPLTLELRNARRPGRRRKSPLPRSKPEPPNRSDGEPSRTTRYQKALAEFKAEIIPA